MTDKPQYVAGATVAKHSIYDVYSAVTVFEAARHEGVMRWLAGQEINYSKYPQMRFAVRRLAVLDTGHMAKLIGGHHPDIVKDEREYRLSEYLPIDPLMRIEVRSYDYKEFWPEKLPSGGGHMVGLRPKTGVSLIALYPSGKIETLVEFGHNNQVAANNIAVELREALGLNKAPPVASSSGARPAGFDL